MADIGWARSRGSRAEAQGLRRGAWYRVVEDQQKAYVVLAKGEKMIEFFDQA